MAATRPPGAAVMVECLFCSSHQVDPNAYQLGSSMHRFFKKRKHDIVPRVKKQQTHVKHLSKSTAAESLGWIGALFVLLSYILLSFEVISGSSVVYHGIFLVGSVGLAIVTYRHRAFQSFTVNCIFASVALVTIVRLLAFS